LPGNKFCRGGVTPPLHGIFSKFWGKTKTLTQRREAAKIFKGKDSLVPDFARQNSIFFAPLRLCVKKAKNHPELLG
jgi:hypothetical protein